MIEILSRKFSKHLKAIPLKLTKSLTFPYPHYVIVPECVCYTNDKYVVPFAILELEGIPRKVTYGRFVFLDHDHGVFSY